MPIQPNNPVTLKVLALVLATNLAGEVSSFTFHLTQQMIEAAQTRASNAALMYAVFAGSEATSNNRIDLSVPSAYFNKALETMQNASTPEEAAVQGVIAVGVLASAAACTSENNAAIAFGALLAALCQNVFFGQSVSNIFSIKVYLIKKILMKIIVEIRIEKRRRELKLPYKSIFRLKRKKNKKLSFSYPRIKGRTVKICSKNLTFPVFYNKKIKIKSEPMVQVINVK